MVVSCPAEVSQRIVPHTSATQRQDRKALCDGAYRETIRVPLFEREASASVLERETTVLGYDARAETGIVAENERACIALLVGGCEIHRVGRREGRASADVDGGFLGVKELCAGAKVVLWGGSR